MTIREYRIALNRACDLRDGDVFRLENTGGPANVQTLRGNPWNGVLSRSVDDGGEVTIRYGDSADSWIDWRPSKYELVEVQERI